MRNQRRMIFFLFLLFERKPLNFLAVSIKKRGYVMPSLFDFIRFEQLINVQDIVRLAFPEKHKLHHLSFP